MSIYVMFSLIRYIQSFKVCCWQRSTGITAWTINNVSWNEISESNMKYSVVYFYPSKNCSRCVLCVLDFDAIDLIK